MDRSGLLGVNLSNGSLGTTSPVSISVGNGGFPYELSGSLSWHPGTPASPYGPVSPIAPEPGWSNNWLNSLALSGSGMEAMGASDIRAAVGAIVFFYAAQDIYQSAYAPAREAAAVLTQAWWSHQLSGNVATVNVGGNTRQFVKLATGGWIAPGAGFATFAQTNGRVPFEETCFHVQQDNTPYALSRGWDGSGISFTATGAQGDTQSFGYFDNGYHTDDRRICGHLKGFRLTGWTFPYGASVTPTYAAGNPLTDTFDTLASVSNSIGRSLGFSATQITAGTRAVTLDASSGLIGSMKDALGNETRFTYQPGHAASTTQRPVPYALLASITTPEHPTQHNTDYTYDGLGRVETVADAVAIQKGTRGPYQFFLADGTRGERDDPLGQPYTLVYDTYGHPSRYIDEVGQETDTLFDSRGRTVQTVYPEGDCEAFAYDDHNNTTDLWRVDKTSACNTAAGSSHVLHATATWHATWNKPLTVTNFRRKTTTLAYYETADPQGDSLIKTVTRPTIPEGTPVYSFAYDTKGKLTDMTGPTGIVTHNTYDATENLTSTIVDYATSGSHLNLTTAFGYDTTGNVTSTTDPRGNVTASLYDNNRRKTEDDHHDGSATAALNAASKTIYDAIGRVTDDQVGTAFSGTSVTTWLTTKHTTYTPTSKVATVTDADSRVTATAYDDGDRTLTVTDPVGRKVHYRYCAAGVADCAANAIRTEYRAWQSGNACVVSGFDQQCYRRITYTPNGQQLTLKDANGNTTNFTYDGFDRLVKTTFPDATYEQITPDPNGNVTAKRNRAGTTLSYAYDDLDQMRTKTMPQPALADLVTSWTYLLDGRVDTLSDTNTNSIGYGYDTAARMTSVENVIPGFAGHRIVNYALDANGNRTKLTWPTVDGGDFAAYCYDSLNRMTAAKDNDTDCATTTSRLAAFSYDAQSRRTGVTYAGGAQMNYPSYSDAGDLLSLGSVFPSTTTSSNAWTYTYTDAHQTLTADNDKSGWEWKPPANNSTSYTTNNLNQYPAVGSQTTGGTNCQGAAQGLSYDCNGNLTFDGTTTFGYDAENRLLTASKTGLTATYAYDPLGRRTKKSGTGVTTTYFLSDGTDEIAEYDSSKNLTRRIIPGPAIDEPIAIITATGGKTFFHADKQGSVIGMSDGTGALAEGPYTYDPYGNCFVGSTPCAPSATQTPYLYTGRKWDAEIGCYYYRARFYCADDKHGGRFIQGDPVGYMPDLDLYTYVGNDPTNKLDPSGNVVVPALVNGATISDYHMMLDYLSRSKTWNSRFGVMQASPHMYTIVLDPLMKAEDQQFDPYSRSTFINPNLSMVVISSGLTMSPSLTMSHEFAGHAFELETNPKRFWAGRATPTELGSTQEVNGVETVTVMIGISPNEEYASNAQNQIARELREPTQKDYHDVRPGKRGVSPVPHPTQGCPTVQQLGPGTKCGAGGAGLWGSGGPQ